MAIEPFVEQVGIVFSPDVAKLIGEAFDAASKHLHDRPDRSAAHELVAKRIIDAAQNGERDPVRLRDAGLAALSPSRGRKLNGTKKRM